MNRSVGLWLWDQYKNYYVKKIATDEDIKRVAIAFYYGEEFLKKENELLVMKKNYKNNKGYFKK